MADVHVAVTAPTLFTNGNVDLTVSGFGTPKAAIVYYGTVASLGTMGVWARGSIGFTDGTRQSVCSTTWENAQATTDTERNNTSDELAMLTQNGTIFGEYNFSAWITDGLRLAVGVYPGFDLYGWAVLFNGDDLTAYAGNFQVAAQDVLNDVTAPGMEPDIVYFTTVGLSTEDTITAHGTITHGVASNGASVSQCSHGMMNEDNQASVFLSGIKRDNAALSLLGISAESYYLDVTAFDANGFDCYARGGNGGNSYVYYLALNLGGANFSTGDISLPTSTGNTNHPASSMGFTPQFVNGGVSHIINNNTRTTGANCFGFFSFDDTTEVAMCFSDDHGAATSNSDTEISLQTVDTNTSGTDGTYDATFVSMNSGTWTSNYTNVDGSARLGWYCAIEEASVVGGAAQHNLTLLGVGA